MKQKLFSVVITSYNFEKFIDKTLHSVIDQKFDDFEVILVDDCSTDRTFEICQEIAQNTDKEVRLFQTETNTGNEGMPCIIGMNMASGKYLLYLDGDDQLSKNSLEHLSILAKSDPDLLCYNRSYSAPNVSPPPPPAPPLSDSQYLKDFLRLHMDSGAVILPSKKTFC